MFAQGKIEFDKETAYLLETLKVESYYNKKNFTLTLQNKDLALLNKIEDILKEINIIPSKRLLLKVRLDDETKKEEIKFKGGDREINFHIEKSPFDERRVKAVTSLPYEKEHNLKLKHNGKFYPINIVSNRNSIVINSELICWIYKDIRFPSNRIFEFLNKFGGDKNKFTEFLFKSNKETIMAAFSALVDCEGTINWYGFKREIQIRMRNKDYLYKWSKLLNLYKIGNRTSKKVNKKGNWELIISGWEDFDKLEKLGFKLHHSQKSAKWGKMMVGFKINQISRGSYKQYYVGKLRKIKGKITAKEFALKLNKSKRVINHYLLKLEKEKLIQVDKTKRPYLYFIST